MVYFVYSGRSVPQLVRLEGWRRSSHATMRLGVFENLSEEDSEYLKGAYLAGRALKLREIVMRLYS